MKFSRMFNSLPKRLAAGALVALAIALPVAASAADAVKIEAQTGVANVTAGDTTYKSSVNATYNQVVKVEVTYNNDEAAGSNKVANNLHVKINVPTGAGASQTITTTTAADNSNTVNGSATVKLDGSDAYLQYIPGTAEWKHADAQTGKVVEQKVSDNVVTASNGLVLENENPCQAGSVAVSVGVMVPGVSIDKQVRVKGSSTWATSITAKPSDTVQYLITYKNTGNTTENNVVIGDKLPAGITYVPGSSYLSNDSGTKSIPDGLTTTGVVIGSYTANGNAYVIFNATLPSNDQLPTCGLNTLRNIASAQPKGMNYYYNTADVNVNKTCTPPNQPTYSCDAFHVTTGDNRTVKVDTFKFTSSNNSKFDSVVLDWGDSSTVTTNNVVGQQHQYGKDGSYAISLSKFVVNGKQVNVNGTCVQTVNFTTPGTPTPPSTPGQPTQLVNTGAGDVVGIFAAVAILGAFAHRLFLSRRLARQ